MHQVTLDRWSRLASPIHRLDARAKIVGALALLVSLVAFRPAEAWLPAGYFALVMVLAAVARLPLAGVLVRATVVLPFAGPVAALSLFGGDAARGAVSLAKSYVCACIILFLLGTTSLPALLRGLESLGAPRFFLIVAQFLYRYLFVLSEQAQHMMQARRCRAPRSSRRGLAQFASGALAALFARSYGRAERIHQAMLARGFQGHLALAPASALGRAEWFFLASVAVAVALLQLTPWTP